MDAHRERHLEESILTPGNKRKGAYGCCLDLLASQYTSEIAKNDESLELQYDKVKFSFDR